MECIWLEVEAILNESSVLCKILFQFLLNFEFAFPRTPPFLIAYFFIPYFLFYIPAPIPLNPPLPFAGPPGLSAPVA